MLVGDLTADSGGKRYIARVSVIPYNHPLVSRRHPDQVIINERDYPPAFIKQFLQSPARFYVSVESPGKLEKDYGMFQQ